jgi:cytochrome oxidase Cu insertion factor (SCO1/SenC/PrrC family)
MTSRRPERIPTRVAAVAVALAATVGVGGGFAFHQLRGSAAKPVRAPALPALHGQAVWAAGARPAPAIALRDQDGRRLSLAALRGRPVLLTFMDSRCHAQCPVEGRQLAAVLRALPPAQRPTLVVVGVDPAGDTPRSIVHAMRKWTLAGPWRWHWLRGTRAQLARVWHAYGVTVDPRTGDIAHSLVLYLVDRDGSERTAYLFPFLPGFVQRDLATLARGSRT